MATPRLSEEKMKEALAAFAKHKTVEKAAKALKCPIETFRHRLRRAEDWKAAGEKDADPLDVRRLKDSLKVQRERADQAEKLALADRTIREAAFSLAADPLDPPHWNVKPDKMHKREAIVLMLSDVHMGEVVDINAMGGRNSYNVGIAQCRLERYFQVVIKLATEHWSGPDPDCIYLVLGGDMVSGEIHDELAKTNSLLSLPAVRAVSQCIVAGLDLLARAFPKIPINVISVPGNHGRTTRKPESKQFAVNSYDTLVAWEVESWFTARGTNENVSFSAPQSGDALVNIHGWNILFTHGDRIGSRGGQGFIGPAATATRGMKKVVEDFLSEGQIVDWIVMGHLHTPLQLEYGFVNPSLVGPSEYSRSGRMKSHGASQWMLTIHPTRGIARRWLVQCGHPSEGSIYKGRVA
jgi:predicted phosphodiesterase